MSNDKIDEVALVIRGFKKLGEEHFAEEFIRMITEVDAAYIPKKIGFSEPCKTPFSLDETKKMWVESEKVNGFYGSIILTGRNFYWDISWKNDGSNDISFHISRNLVIKNLDKFIKLAKNIFLWVNGVYGYSCHSSNPIYTPGLDYKTCLGHITWMTLFGAPYVKLFGKEVIEKAPCKVEEFAENRFMLLTTDEPVSKNPEMLELQEKVKIHLGADAFYRDEPRQRIFTMEDIRAGKNRPNTEGYRSPDLSEYINDSVEKKEEGLIAQVNDDGTITTYNVNSEKK